MAGTGRVQALNPVCSAARHHVALAVQNKINLLAHFLMVLGIRNLPVPDQEFVENREGMPLNGLSLISSMLGSGSLGGSRAIPRRILSPMMSSDTSFNLL